MLITRRSQDPKLGDIKAATPPTQTLDKTVHAIRNQIAKWNSRRHSRVISKSDISPETLAGQTETTDSQPSCSGAISRLPVEIIEEIITSVGYDIPLIPHQLDRLRSPRQFHAYFELVEDKVRDRNKVIRNLRLVSRLWNQLATTHADRYIVIRMGVTNFQELLNSKSDPLQVRHVWILPLALQDGVDPTIFSGLRPIALIFGRFRNLETFYCRSYDCYEMFGSEHIREIGVPPKLRVWGIEGPCLRDWVHGVLQTKILRLFPQLETLVQVGLCTEGNWNPMLDNPCSITMVFDRSQNSDVYFSKFQSLSLAGGPLLQDDTIVALANLCPPIRSLCICGFDRNFTMKGLEALLQLAGPGLESLHLAIRQSEQLWGVGTHHLCRLVARTCQNLHSLSIGEEDSFNRPVRSTSCCRDLFDLAEWRNLVDCHLCVYPGRGGCLDQSEGTLDALVESARAVALRNSHGAGTIIRIKVDYTSQISAKNIWVSSADTMTTLGDTPRETMFGKLKRAASRYM